MVLRYLALPSSDKGKKISQVKWAREKQVVSFLLSDNRNRLIFRMASSGMLRRVALVRTDVWKELSAFIFRVTRIGELGTA
jgi:hypothetical protein